MNPSVASRFDSCLDAVRGLLRNAGATLAYLFGSAARGHERAESDLDVAILLGREVPPERYGELRLRLLTELVGFTHVNDIDLVFLNVAPPLLAHQVITTGRLFLGSRRDQVRFEVEAIKRYIDTRPLRERVARALDRRIREGAPTDREPAGRW